jgi:hydrogenase maturation protease
MNQTVVLGVGNPLMRDEGIGEYLVEQLKSTDAGAYADIIPAGTSAMSLLHQMSGRKKAVILDCALMGSEPGTIKRFLSEDVKSIKKLSHYSLHEADVLKIIELARELGQCPDEVVFFGIEPVAIEPGQFISEELLGHVPEYVDMILAEIRKD